MTVDISIRDQNHDLSFSKEFLDVSQYHFTENTLTLSFNNGKIEEIPLRDNDGVGTNDWGFVTVRVIRAALSISMGDSK